MIVRALFRSGTSCAARISGPNASHLGALSATPTWGSFRQAAVPVAIARNASFSTLALARCGLPLQRLLGGSRLHVPAPLVCPTSGATSIQTRNFAGRIGGFKRRKRSAKPRTVQQTGLGKRMEFFWPKGSHRSRVPMYENSRRHVIWDHSRRRWMVMWYRHGIQVFRTFNCRGDNSKFEQSRMRAIIFFQQLQNAGKLGKPKPDQNRSGVRGVFFDKGERSWVSRWNDCGLKKHAVFNTQEMGFAEAYKAAVRSRIQNMRQQHMFMFQRTRWRSKRHPLGMMKT
eukprot:gnl/TRDRNA2_/TRDRNA2_190901_c0_seq1.p1 gnl/TRDRNA2_/TRDRNA2_190901_c0~~gnl/TRDRNA2_/TRDRNA2_190901_c0_seq1.p1  ORF type:complete len:285 (+),score=29.36 gnl/TRDRNA2_/TRDRNA2_190901_c0_seq1:67-921(+)